MIELRLLCSVIFDSMKISLWHGGFEMKIRHLELENVTVFDKIEIYKKERGAWILPLPNVFTTE
mgnify:CR=1 FL=1